MLMALKMEEGHMRQKNAGDLQMMGRQENVISTRAPRRNVALPALIYYPNNTHIRHIPHKL